ncbi:AAA-like domain-containing protein [Lysobacter sp. cf310]|uniref:AAA-like domain-containing protein n=1 Tax=Lysobacter sp. cf310 TaxID=1761790 RepID=UPI0008E1D28E|nr:AAA-like domain-containing protein [Lysobacter sp. cf310]SFK69775.1 AAA-like domain-containing protein [Lysobacter sp. cf310]
MRQEIVDYARSRPKCERLFRALSTSFDVTFATDRKFHRAEFYVFFLKPDVEVAQAFGLNYEILGVYSPFPTAQPRMAQAIEQIINDAPAKGRVDRIVVFVFSDDFQVAEWAARYAMDHPDSRIMIAAHAASLASAVNPKNAVRDLLQSRLYHIDLFDYRLPLNSDAFYFGRSHDLTRITGAIDRGENAGIFGLRKTGKTSFIFKLRRVLEDSDKAWFFYYDCKLPEVRSLRWDALLTRISKDIAQKLGVKWKDPSADQDVTVVFRDLVLRSRVKIVLAFDEIEFISPNAILDPHWRRDFVDFWQTIWGVQSQIRKLVAIISGVIPKVAEVERFSGVQNPLFSIVRPHFLKGFPEEDVGKMVKAIGGKVGVVFDDNAISHLVGRYGGHPYLTRLACSSVLDALDLKGAKRPIKVASEDLIANQDGRERQLLPYVRHIVTELKDFYPVEYEVLEMLSLNKYSEYHDLAVDPEFVEHLRSFGIVAEVNGLDEISIPVAKKYIASEWGKRNGVKYSVEVVPNGERANWYRLKSRAILDGMRQLADYFRQTLKQPFLPVGGVSEADKFVDAPLANDAHSYSAFFIIANRCFVESIEVFMKEKGVQGAVNGHLHDVLPRLAIALQRIRVYRHDAGHIELSVPNAIRLRDDFLKEDLGGRQRGTVEDVHFVLQQCAVDGLMNAIQAELVANRLV